MVLLKQRNSITFKERSILILFLYPDLFNYPDQDGGMVGRKKEGRAGRKNREKVVKERKEEKEDRR